MLLPDIATAGTLTFLLATNHVTRAVTSPATAGKAAVHVITCVTSRADVMARGSIVARGTGTMEMFVLLNAT